jgi:5-methylcytosine-specific restriction protein A
MQQSESWRKDKRKTGERGYGWRWQKARATWLARPENVLCRFCKAQGRITPAILIDHVIPHRGDQKLFWDTTNWQPLCKPCHDVTKAALERGNGMPIGEDGWPIGN